MGIISVELLLEYLYTKFAVTWILVLIGVFIRESSGIKSMKEIKFLRSIALSILIAALVCAISERIGSFSIYTIVCILSGMWGRQIYLMLLDKNIISKILGNAIKGITPEDISKSIMEASDKNKEEAENTQENAPIASPDDPEQGSSG